MYHQHQPRRRSIRVDEPLSTVRIEVRPRSSPSNQLNHPTHTNCLTFRSSSFSRLICAPPLSPPPVISFRRCVSRLVHDTMLRLSFSFFVFVFVSVFVATFSAVAHGQGLTFDLCNSTSSCSAGRQCYDTSSPSLSECTEDVVSDCVCYPDAPVYCTSSIECVSGEVCARTEDTASACYSSQAVDSTERLFPFDAPPSPIPAPSGPAPPLWESVGSVARGMPCKEPLQCDSGLFCLSFSATACQGPDDNCRCVPSGSGAECEDEEDCDNEDVCTTVNGARFTKACLPQDIATEVVPTIPSAQASPVPIDSIMPLPSDPATSLVPVPSVPVPATSVDASASASAPDASSDPLPSDTVPVPVPSVGVDPLPSISMVPGDVSASPVSVPVPLPSDIETETEDPEDTTDPVTDTSTGSSTSPEASVDMDVSPQPSISTTDAGTVSTTSEPDDDEICVAVEHLRHVSAQHLVYTRHRHAKVLCDERHSCATPGHMVVFNGQPMMMARYCTVHTACTTAVKLVNSVKYSAPRHYMRVASRTSGLELSALAARYASRSEEAVLRLLMRMGL